ncbi:hypothetical protein CLIB1423_02S05402 [[Candida] railenensis]|uniref:Sphingoid long-chain base transporter RSB1 n=1 Tax=[Candida] railenensis TaxID=45579 RepID=A0A9P0QLE2_9ASCO|nr:hypothetical protein CLIB1423_02S05402 [[Candida] railenensis]
MSSAAPSLSSWFPSTYPTKTVFSTVAASETSSFSSLIASAYENALTQTDAAELISLGYEVNGALASMSIASAAEVTATATNQQVLQQANEVIWNSTLYLRYKAEEENLYKYNLQWAPNIIYVIIFGLAFFYTVGMLWKSRYHWYNITFFCGFGLEFIGFIGRCLSVNDPYNINYYLCQYITLTIAPAFLMAGIYFIFAQLVVIHGRHYSVLKPMWYSYFFIASDVLSLLIQSAGGGAASVASNQHKDAKPGTNTMLAGIIFQVVSMTIFIWFWIEFLLRIYFKHQVVSDVTAEGEEPHVLNRKSFKNFFKLLFNVKSVRDYRQNELDKHYNPKFRDIRTRSLFGWYPLAISLSVIFIYIRCVYRVVELAQGFRGWLITREWPIMVLDAFMVALFAIISFPFHPVILFGSENRVKVAHIKKRTDVEEDDEFNDEVTGKDEVTPHEESNNESHIVEKA